MDSDTARYVLNLEGRITALSGIVALLMCVLRQKGALDPAIEHQIYTHASDAIGGLPAEIQASADQLILALQSSSGAVGSPISN